MNEKLYIQDLINLIAEKKEISRKEAEAFLRTFFEVIEQGLDRDKSVKIKGLGTFKLIRVESRESIDVNTGKRCVIEGHTKISFTPDASVRDFINKPFSHFETVILNENVFFEETEPESVENSPLPINLEEKSEPHKSIDIPEAIGLNDSLENSDKSVSPVEQDQEEVNIEITKDSDIKEEEDLLSKPQNTNPEIKEGQEPKETDKDTLQAEITNQKVATDTFETLKVEESNISDSSFKKEEVKEETPTFDSLSKPLSEEGEIPIKSANKKWKAYIAVSLVSVFIIVSVIYYIFNPSIFENIFENSNKATIENTQDINGDDRTSADTIIFKEEDLNKEDILSEEEMLEEEHFFAHNEAELPLETEPERASPQEILSDTTKTIITGLRQGYDNVKADSTSYRIVGTMSIYTLQSGETLTRVSNRFYGSKDLWPYLVMHNRNVIKNPDNVPSSTTIRIPALRDKE